MLGAVSFVLLIACANVANPQVVGQDARQLLLGFAIGGGLAFALGRAAASALDLIDGVGPAPSSR